MEKTVVVTGAGSGVGRAVAVALGAKGWSMALVGRRPEPLAETASSARRAGAVKVLAIPCDIGISSEVSRLASEVKAKLGDPSVLVNAAGTNVPQRSLEVLTEADYHQMIAANLHGPYYCVRAFLPAMRQAGEGTIVNIVSEAGRIASPKAGPGYVISKFGMAGLTQAINAEERGRGIRACSIFPGDIDTPLLDKRPSPPPPEARLKMMQAEDIASCVIFQIELPGRVVIEEMIVRPK